jgi:hypothetical protein
MIAQTFVMPPTARERIADNLRAFLLTALPGKPLRVTVEQHRKRRSDEQNGYLFGVAYKALCEATGYDVEDVHEFMLGEHFGWVDKRVPKSAKFPQGIERVPRRTTTRNESGKRQVLSTVEFAEYVDHVQRFGAEHGVFIPDPDPMREAA